jgi:hypothetical protein
MFIFRLPKSSKLSDSVNAHETPPLFRCPMIRSDRPGHWISHYLPAGNAGQATGAKVIFPLANPVEFTIIRERSRIPPWSFVTEMSSSPCILSNL